MLGGAGAQVPALQRPLWAARQAASLLRHHCRCGAGGAGQQRKGCRQGASVSSPRAASASVRVAGRQEVLWAHRVHPAPSVLLFETGRARGGSIKRDDLILTSLGGRNPKTFLQELSSGS